MKCLALKFNIPDISSVTDKTKDSLIGEFSILNQRRLQEIWKPQIPPREKVSFDAQGCCVSIMDDWECAIFGSSFVNCLLSLSLVHEFLNGYFKKPVSFRVLDPPMKMNALDSMITHERRKARLITIIKFIIVSLISVLIGYYLDYLINSFGR